MVLRKIGGKVSPYEHIKQEGDLWILDITSTFKNVYLKFKLGEEFDETTADGRNVKVSRSKVKIDLSHCIATAYDGAGVNGRNLFFVFDYAVFGKQQEKN